eukprot:11740932-Alexandrium_andersonii.AAC.1
MCIRDSQRAPESSREHWKAPGSSGEFQRAPESSRVHWKAPGSSGDFQKASRELRKASGRPAYGFRRATGELVGRRRL